MKEKLLYLYMSAFVCVWRKKNCYRGLCNFLISSVPLVTNNISDWLQCYGIWNENLQNYEIYIFFLTALAHILFIFPTSFFSMFFALSLVRFMCILFFTYVVGSHLWLYDEGVMSGDIINILASSCVLSHSHLHNNAGNILWTGYFPSFSFIFIVCAP